MSNAILPALAGLGWSVKRTPQWSNAIQEAISGKQTANAYWSYPRWLYELTYGVLRDYAVPGVAYTELQTLIGFINARQGSFDPWLYLDPNDNTAVAQSIGTGDGATTEFQLVRAYGGFAEPVLAPGVVNDVAINGVIMNASASGTIATPGAPSLAGIAGGTLGAATYFAKVTRVAPAGETLPGSEASLALAANHLLQVAPPAAQPGATGWNLYVATASGAETRQNGATPLAFGQAWTLPATGLVSGAAPPSGGNLAWSVSGWGATGYAPGGVVTFGTAPASGTAIAADFGYYWPCRFGDAGQGDMSFEEIMYQLWQLKSLKFMTLK